MKISINKKYSFFLIFKDKVKINLTFFLIVFFFTEIHSSEIPKNKVSNFHDVLIKVNSLEKSFVDRLEIIKKEINQTFNYKRMMQFIYGRKWNKLESNQKDIISETFLNFISATYTKRFHMIDGLNFEYLESKKTDDGMILVNTNLLIPNEDSVKFKYVFINEEDDWKILDILINGTISEIATKKSEYSKIIKSEGVDGLIKKLSEKTNNLN
ncbi:MAG: hypothetical protein CMP41_03750 [Rickettsiales bacterium]|nr:hypothetical protein [Rickettsiales bacterium]